MGGCKSTKQKEQWLENLMDEEMEIVVMTNDNGESNNKIRHGKGNAALGVKADYMLYPPSNVYERVWY